MGTILYKRQKEPYWQFFVKYCDQMSVVGILRIKTQNGEKNFLVGANFGG